MTVSVECVGQNETLEQAAQKMLYLDVGALPVCGGNERLQGVVTDRDIVVKCLALGGDPRVMMARELGEGTPVTIGADDDIEEAIEVMQANQLGRLPVIDGPELIGMLA
ncbi:CBS domain-containing protein [Arthrobacter rhombi]|uniref:CBS domain-containing protein n=1 Tax=Arthrobacter rhombi TaxID=71253 RepID=UPI003FCFB983